MSYYKKNILKETSTVQTENYGEFPMPSYEDIASDSLEGKDGLKFRWLYRVFFKNQLSSIAKNGYDREFTGSQGGNFYGAGVYTTWSLKDTMHNVSNTTYGDTIMRMKLIGGFTKFIILDKKLAQEVYGENWTFEKQIKLLMGKKADEIISQSYSRGQCGTHITSEMDGGRTAGVAKFLTNAYFKEMSAKGVRGILYKGNLDGRVALPFDFSAVIPHSYDTSYKTTRKIVWKPIFDKKLYDRLNNSIDTDFRYGSKYSKTFKPTLGIARVKNFDGKFNYIDIQTDEELSDVWFDMATEFDENGHAIVKYKSMELMITRDGVLLDEDEDDVIDFERIPDIYEIWKKRQAKKQMAMSNESIKLTETDLNYIVESCIKKILKNKKRR